MLRRVFLQLVSGRQPSHSRSVDGHKFLVSTGSPSWDSRNGSLSAALARPTADLSQQRDSRPNTRLRSADERLSLVKTLRWSPALFDFAVFVQMTCVPVGGGGCCAGVAGAMLDRRPCALISRCGWWSAVTYTHGA